MQRGAERAEVIRIDFTHMGNTKNGLRQFTLPRINHETRVFELAVQLGIADT
jgi:hypothetical protein